MSLPTVCTLKANNKYIPQESFKTYVLFLSWPFSTPNYSTEASFVALGYSHMQRSVGTKNSTFSTASHWRNHSHLRIVKGLEDARKVIRCLSGPCRTNYRTSANTCCIFEERTSWIDGVCSNKNCFYVREKCTMYIFTRKQEKYTNYDFVEGPCQYYCRSNWSLIQCIHCFSDKLSFQRNLRIRWGSPSFKWELCIQVHTSPPQGLVDQVQVRCLKDWSTKDSTIYESKISRTHNADLLHLQSMSKCVTNQKHQKIKAM